MASQDGRVVNVGHGECLRAYQLLVDIDSSYRKAQEHLSFSEDWLPALFLLRSHSCYLGATRLAVSGQLAEAYMVLRGCLEASLYAHFLYRDPPSRGPIWIARHDSDQANRFMRKTFQMRSILECLDHFATSVGARARNLYERTIDYGGHPNESAFLQSMSLNTAEGGGIQVSLNYLTGDCPAYQVCIQVTADAGLCSLEINRLVFRERFDIIGLSETLASLRARLRG